MQFFVADLLNMFVAIVLSPFLRAVLVVIVLLHVSRLCEYRMTVGATYPRVHATNKLSKGGVILVITCPRVERIRFRLGRLEYP